MRYVIGGLLMVLMAGLWGCQSDGDMRDHHGAHDRDHDRNVLRHVVLFAWKAETPAAKVREIEQAFAALPGKIDTIRDFEWGTDVSVEGKAKGFTHCFVVTFKDSAGLAAYIPHPAHEDFVTLIRPHLADVLVIDYRPGR